jgi:hypothetical protein
LSFFFWLAGSKHSQYLGIQPSEYAGFPYASWWKEREGNKRKKVALLEREREIKRF